MDRRTLAKKLQGLPPAHVKRLKTRVEKRWKLADVLPYIQQGITEPVADDDSMECDDLFFMGLYDRLDNWKIIHPDGEEDLRYTFQEAVEHLPGSADDIILWLRLGCPYIKRGSLETGEGFEFIPAHVLDWLVMMKRVTRQAEVDFDFLPWGD
jgi:hypothetical protein